MSQEINAELPGGGPLSSQDIIKQLNNPYSRLRRDVSVYVSAEFYNGQLENQHRFLEMIQSEREQLRALSQHSGTSSQAVDMDEKMLTKLEPIPAKNQELLQKLQVQSHELDGLYKEYDKIRQNLIEIKGTQIKEYNTVLIILGLDEKYNLTPEKQEKLDAMFKETEENTQKLKEMTGVTTSEPKKDLLNEMKYMRLQTERGEAQNLSTSEIKTLAKGKDPESKKSLFQIINESQKGILVEEKNREALIPKIVEKENDVRQTAAEINQNTAQLRPLLTPNFSSAKNDEEAEKKLKEMYDNFEKIHKQSGSSLNMGDAFQYHLDSQLKQMQPAERKEFFEKTEGFNPKDEKQRNIFSALTELREKYNYQPETPKISSETPKPSAPTPFNTKPI